MTKVLASTKAKVIAAAIAVFVLLVIAFVAVYFYYGARALPGATVAGEPVGGMTAEEIAVELNTQSASQQVTVVGVGDEPIEINMPETGVGVDVSKTVAAVFEPNQGFGSRVSGFFGGHEVEPVVVVNTEKFDIFLDEFGSDILQGATDGEVKYNKEQGIFVAADSASGLELEEDVFASQLVDAAQGLSNTTVEVELLEVAPAYPTEVLKAAAEKANGWLDLEITAQGNGEWVQAERGTVASWVKFEPVEGSIVPKIDREKVKAWVSDFAKTTNNEPVPGVQNVNSAGTVVATAVWGIQGHLANNVDDVVNGIADSLQSGDSHYAEFTYETAEPEYTTRLIADGAENLPYAAAPGEKWIDINLSSHQVIAYEGATVALTMPMISGAPDTPTITGEYSVYWMPELQTMKGKNADGTDYETPDVPWIMYFQGGYALHGAYWRSSFGYDAGSGGSHGCVNLPVDSARQLYNWTEIGTKVVSHY